MQLHVVVKQLVLQHGASIITESKLASMLSDLRAYDECPAMKHVLRDTIKLGYARKILNGSFSTKSDIPLFAHDTNYRADLISYACDTLLFALGKCTSVTVPQSIGYDPCHPAPQPPSPSSRPTPTSTSHPSTQSVPTPHSNPFSSRPTPAWRHSTSSPFDNLRARLDELEERMRKKRSDLDAHIARLDHLAQHPELFLHKQPSPCPPLLPNLFLKNAKTVTINGKLNFSDILAWFKKHNLNKNRHIPFIMRYDNSMRTMLGQSPARNNTTSLILGIYDNTTNTTTCLHIQCDALDDKTSQLLANNYLITLQ